MHPIALNLEYIDLIAEKGKNSERLKLELFQASHKKREFIIPGGEKEFKVEFEFIYNELDTFEITGLLSFFMLIL